MVGGTAEYWITHGKTKHHCLKTFLTNRHAKIHVVQFELKFKLPVNTLEYRELNSYYQKWYLFLWE